MPDTAHRRQSRWKLEDAKARFSELVRRANSEGPQTVTVRGKEAAVVLSAEEFAALQPPPADRVPWADFIAGLDLEGLDLSREPDFGREVDL
jgi:prevent-host-death family protein